MATRATRADLATKKVDAERQRGSPLTSLPETDADDQVNWTLRRDQGVFDDVDASG